MDQGPLSMVENNMLKAEQQPFSERSWHDGSEGGLFVFEFIVLRMIFLFKKTHQKLAMLCEYELFASNLQQPFTF